MSRPKLITVIVLAVLAVVILFQNIETGDTNILFWTVPVPRALFFFCAVLLGFAAGVLVTKSYLKKP